MTSRRYAGSALVAAALIVGCSGPIAPVSPGATVGGPGSTESPTSPSSAPPAIPRIPACELIFEAEASRSIGVTIEVSEATEQTADDGVGWLSECVYWRDLHHGLAPMDLTLAAGDTYLTWFDELKADPEARPKSGLGDEAFLRLSTLAGLEGPVGALFVRTGNAVLGLSLGIVDMTDSGELVLAGDGDEQTEILVKLARMALDRLTSPAPETARTCELIPLAEMVATVGVPLNAAEDVDEHDAWGPACHYTGSDEFIEVYLSVNTGPLGREQFDACEGTSEPVVGLGDEAFVGRGECSLRIGMYFTSTPLLVRSGDTILAVGRREGGLLDDSRWRETLADVARVALERLGAGPGATPPPVATNALVHPCELISDGEVASIVGTAIASHAEWSADETGLNAECYYSTDDLSIMPFHVRLGSGPEAVREFGSYKTYASAGYTAVSGVGDDAVTNETEGLADQPLLSLFILHGDALLELDLGPVGLSADFSTPLAPGTPEEQLAMLRQIAELILPRLSG